MSRIKNSRFLREVPKVVGTVHSSGSTRSALRLQPEEIDFLELRVDHFAENPGQLLDAARRFPSPLIVTIRHPDEGGANSLDWEQRRRLFHEFLPLASCVDIELRSVDKLADIIAEARRRGVAVIVSDHHFTQMPSLRSLKARLTKAAQAKADVFKIAALAETASDLGVLLNLSATDSPIPLSVMGMGRFGKVSRLALAQAGSVLNYGYLDKPNASGQWEARLLKKRLAELAD